MRNFRSASACLAGAALVSLALPAGFTLRGWTGKPRTVPSPKV